MRCQACNVISNILLRYSTLVTLVVKQPTVYWTKWHGIETISKSNLVQYNYYKATWNLNDQWHYRKIYQSVMIPTSLRNTNSACLKIIDQSIWRDKSGRYRAFLDTISNFIWFQIWHLPLMRRWLIFVFYDGSRLNLSFNLYPQSEIYLMSFFTQLKLCLYTATHNFKWVKVTRICLIWSQTFANLDVYTPILFPISVT